MTTTETDQHLDAVTIRQLTWKSGIATSVAVAIVRHMITCPGVLWPDEISYDSVPSLTAADANCIRIAYRNLTRQGIIAHGTSFRRSTAENSRGRTIFCYTLASRSRAELFLRRNGVPVKPQPELFEETN